jgi:ABC-type transporter Mla maintaining outer membrane lipid asymmetry ATPase subunit MlaF
MPGASGEALIKMEGIKKIFYTDEVETHALADIHLEIKPGEYIAIAGPSGCGKTTLLSILGLLDTPTDGSYVLHLHLLQQLDGPGLPHACQSMDNGPANQDVCQRGTLFEDRMSLHRIVGERFGRGTPQFFIALEQGACHTFEGFFGTNGNQSQTDGATHSS